MIASEETISRLVEIQSRLNIAVRAAYPKAYDLQLLLDFPRNGEVATADGRWKFMRHGTGMRFERLEPSPNLIVDMHRRFEDPALIDTWRILQFVESWGQAASKEGVAKELAALEAAGTLKAVSEGYTLVNRAF